VRSARPAAPPFTPVDPSSPEALAAVGAYFAEIGRRFGYDATGQADRDAAHLVPPDGVFDALVMSYQVGVRKPMREIFDHAASVAGVPPEACLLVDDLSANCAGAVSAGWRAVEFKDTRAAVAQVARLTGTGPA